MRTLFLFLIIGLLIGCNQLNQSEEFTDNSTVAETSFDSILAAKLGADEYGMKQYVMAFLKRGPNRDFDSLTSAQLQRAHLDNITRMAQEGKLVLAGPFLDREDVRGIYIFNVSSIEEAKILTETDPAIKAGSLEMELRPWYGSAALIQINDLHSKIAKINI